MLCPNGHPTTSGRNFCGVCGEPLVVRCPNGHAVAAGGRYCGVCGVAVQDVVSSPGRREEQGVATSSSAERDAVTDEQPPRVGYSTIPRVGARATDPLAGENRERRGWQRRAAFLVAAAVLAGAGVAGALIAAGGGASLRGSAECSDPQGDQRIDMSGPSASPNNAADVTDARLTADGRILIAHLAVVGQIPSPPPPGSLGGAPLPLGVSYRFEFFVHGKRLYDLLIGAKSGQQGWYAALHQQGTGKAPNVGTVAVQGNQVDARVPLSAFQAGLSAGFRWYGSATSATVASAQTLAEQPNAPALTDFVDYCPEPDALPHGSGTTESYSLAHMAGFPNRAERASATTEGTSTSGLTESTAHLPSTTQASGRLTSTDRLGVNGIGPVVVGMSVEQAAAASGSEISLSASAGSGDCRTGTPANGPTGLSFMVINRRIVRIDVGSGRISTQSGIHIGSSEQEVMQTYPGQITTEPHPYDASGHYLIYTPRDPALRAFLIIFETDGAKVTSFRSGEADAVRAQEGCA